MQKIMFNDRYGLTQAVIEGRKTMTRRIIRGSSEFPDDIIENARYFYLAGSITVISNSGETLFELTPRYKLGEVVAVAQCYNDATREFPHLKTTLVGHDIMGSELACTNKMFVRADFMPHRIQITNIRCERLQDISDADCLREGIRYIPKINKFYFEDVTREEGVYFDNHREAFAVLIDKVSGRGTWGRNPWVVAYEFKLVK